MLGQMRVIICKKKNMYESYIADMQNHFNLFQSALAQMVNK